MRRFCLQRDIDATGVSGTGRVAEGVIFSNGRVVVSWLTEVRSQVSYDSISDVEAIHGHGGKTRIIFIDPG